MPQTITRTKTLYTFEELSERAKETARDWYRNARTDWWTPDEMEFVIDDAERIGAILGITIGHRTYKTMGGGTRSEPEVYYDLSGRYGQTVGFNGSYSYAKGAAKAIRAETNDAELIRIADALQAVQRRYFYGLTATIGANRDPDIEVTARHETARYYEYVTVDELTEALNDFAHWVYKQLESEEEYRNSDEAVDEDITANGYTFDQDGNRDD